MSNHKISETAKDMLLKVDSTGLGDLRTAMGIRVTKIAINGVSADLSDGFWRDLLAEGGLRTARIAGRGIFRDAASDETVRGLFFSDTIRDWQVVVPNFGTVEGPFQVSALEFAGQHDGEMTFDLALESAGALNFAISTELNKAEGK